MRMCRYIRLNRGSEVITFSEGIFSSGPETVRKDVYFVQPIMRPNDEFVEVFLDDAFKGSANSSTIIPYFPTPKATKDEPRVSIRARVCGRLNAGWTGCNNGFYLVQGFFKKPVDHLLAMPVLCEYIKKLDLGDLVVVSPDSGFAKHTRKYGSYLGVSVAIGDKIRKSHDETVELLDIIGDVQGKNAVIIDDFSISGGTLVEVAKGLKQRGAKRILACLSHILLNREGVARIEDSPIELVISTDSVDNQWIRGSEKIKTVSVAPLFGEAIMRIHKRVSVSPLFDAVPERVLDEENLLF